jgi:putative transposase
MKLERNNHTKGINAYHFEWCPKYRYRSMGKDRIKEDIGNSFRRTAEEYGIAIIEMVVADDHVHLFVEIPFTMSPSRALQLLKGRSSYDIFRAHPNFRLRYPKGRFWSPGKFVRSVSNITASTVKRYIENHETEELSRTMDIGEERRQLFMPSFIPHRQGSPAL